MSQVLYGERSPYPLGRTVELTGDGLRVGRRVTPLYELNLGAMAEAYQRGHWLGDCGAERPLPTPADGSGTVPVIHATGFCTPVRVRHAARFAHRLGELAVRCCGGPGQVAALSARGLAEGVPLWIARRFAPGPVGQIAVAVERRLARVDVWGPHAPVLRLRAPYGFRPDAAEPSKGLCLTVAGTVADLSLENRGRASRRLVAVRIPGRHWVLRRETATSSRLLCNDRPVAVLTRLPRGLPREPGTVLPPLAPVRYASGDPLDAVMAQLVAASFGLGNLTGSARLRAGRGRPAHGDGPLTGDGARGRPRNRDSGRERSRKRDADRRRSAGASDGGGGE